MSTLSYSAVDLDHIVSSFYRFLQTHQPTDDGDAWLSSLPSAEGQAVVVRLWSKEALDSFKQLLSTGEAMRTAPAASVRS